MTTRFDNHSNYARRKRAPLLLLGAFDTISILAIGTIFSFGLVEPAYAYVDPSVMTYTIQALAGVAVALGAIAGVAFRRTRKWLFNVLKIDENANKVVEPDVLRCNGSEFDAAQKALNQDVPDNEAAARSTAPSLKKRLIWASVASFFVVFTVLVVAPTEIISANRESLIFSIRDCWPPIALFAFCVWIALDLLVLLLRGKAFRAAIIALFVIGIGCYVQAFFLNISLPEANGTSLDLLSYYKKITLLSTAAWTALIAISVIALKKEPRRTPRVICAIAVALIVIQSVGVSSLMLDKDADKAATDSEEVFATEVGLYDLSPKNNVIVFVLDMFDIKNMDAVLEQEPSALDEFTDFTYYHNATADITPTRLGVPYLLTGKSLGEYDYYGDYLTKRFEDSHLIHDVYDAGYSVGLYTDSLWQGAKRFEDICINLGPLDKAAINPWGVIAVAWKMALYRDLPWLLKPLVWYSTDQLNETMADRNTFNERSAPYVLDDTLYFERMKDRPLTLADKGENGAFRFIHLQGAHYPYLIDEQGRLTGHSDVIKQCRGVLLIVSEYFKQMKEAGVYDDATIIVTADHGYQTDTPGIITEPAAPILLVHRPIGQGPKHEGPIAYSNVPTGHQDFAASLIASVGGDYRQYGHTIWDTPDEPRIRNYFMCQYDEEGHPIANIEFEIDGDVNDFANWKLTGRVYNY